MSRGDKWSRRDPDYKAGYRIGRAQAGGGKSGCRIWMWVFALSPAAVGLLGWAGGWLLTVVAS